MPVHHITKIRKDERGMKTRKWISVLLSAVLSLSLSVSAVIAEEEPQEPETEVQEPLTEEPPQEAGEEEPAEKIGEADPAEPGEAEPVPEAESASEEEPAAGEEKPEGEAEESSALEAADEEGQEEENESGEKTSLFSLSEGFTVSAEDRANREEWLSHGALEDFDRLIEGKDYIKGELMLGAERDYAEAVAQVYHGEVTSYSDGIAVITITDEGITVSDVMHAMAEDAGLPFAEPNYLLEPEPEAEDEEEGSGALEEGTLPNVNDWSDWVYDVFKENADPFLRNPSLYTEQDGQVTGLYQWHHTFMKTYLAWNAAMGDGINVAVIDMSVNENHEDLAGNVILDDVCKEKYYGSYGHGTMMAGIIAAKEGNGKGGAGVAPHAKIIGINVFDGPLASVANLVRGINRATERGKNPDGTYDNAKRVHIINMSIGKDMYIQEEAQAVKKALDAGITVLAAAGNEHSNFYEYPGCYDGVICVGAVNMNRNRAGFSNYGPQITVAAPGTNIAAPVTREKTVSNTAYTAANGTSQATAVTSGFLALYMSKFGVITPKESAEVLRQNTIEGPEGLGAGIITFEKMFENDVAAPTIAVYDKNNKQVKNLNNPVPQGSRLCFFDEHPGNRDVIVFTTDGELPEIRNGEVVNGEIYNPEEPIAIDAYERNTELTVIAVIVNSVGVVSQPAAIKLKTPAVKPAAVKIKTVTLNSAKQNLTISRKAKGTAQLSITKLIDVRGASRKPEDVAHQWLSNNPDVAEVDGNGLVTAVAPGTAMIYVKILDGSNKMAGCVVNVSSQVTQIEIIGSAGVAQRSAALYKAEITPSNAKNKRVIWSLAQKVSGVSIDSATGKVTVGAKVPVGTVFCVKAKAADGSGVVKKFKVTVVQPAKKITIQSNDSRAEKDRSGAVKSAVIFTDDIPDEGHPARDNAIEVQAVIQENKIAPEWTSSDASVATVEVNAQTGKVFVVGHKEGTAVITASAADGSGKKAAFALKVITPISMLMMEGGDDYVITAGTALDVGKMLNYGKAYGEPTLKAVEWTIDSAVCLRNGKQVDVKAEALKKKALAIDASGRLYTNYKNMESYLKESSLLVGVKALAKDGTGYWVKDTIVVRSPFEYLFFCDPSSPKEIKPIGSLTITVPKDSRFASVSGYVFCDQNLNLTALTTAADICGAQLDIAPEKNKGVYTDQRTGRKVEGYLFPIKYMTYEKRDTCSIVVNPNDGSENYRGLKVTIINE